MPSQRLPGRDSTTTPCCRSRKRTPSPAPHPPPSPPPLTRLPRSQRRRVAGSSRGRSPSPTTPTSCYQLRLVLPKVPTHRPHHPRSGAPYPPILDDHAPPSVLLHPLRPHTHTHRCGPHTHTHSLTTTPPCGVCRSPVPLVYSINYKRTKHNPYHVSRCHARYSQYASV